MKRSCCFLDYLEDILFEEHFEAAVEIYKEKPTYYDKQYWLEMLHMSMLSNRKIRYFPLPTLRNCPKIDCTGGKGTGNLNFANSSNPFWNLQDFEDLNFKLTLNLIKSFESLIYRGSTKFSQTRLFPALKNVSFRIFDSVQNKSPPSRQTDCNWRDWCTRWLSDSIWQTKPFWQLRAITELNSYGQVREDYKIKK